MSTHDPVFYVIGYDDGSGNTAGSEVFMTQHPFNSQEEAEAYLDSVDASYDAFVVQRLSRKLSTG